MVVLLYLLLFLLLGEVLLFLLLKRLLPLLYGADVNLAVVVERLLAELGRRGHLGLRDVILNLLWDSCRKRKLVRPREQLSQHGICISDSTVKVHSLFIIGFVYQLND